jgi:hypothetical protein
MWIAEHAQASQSYKTICAVGLRFWNAGDAAFKTLTFVALEVSRREVETYSWLYIQGGLSAGYPCHVTLPARLAVALWED